MKLVSALPHTHIENGKVTRIFPPEPHWLVRLYDWFEKPRVAKINMTISLAILTACLFLAGCATLRDNPASARLGVTIVVAKFIENSSPDKKEERRARVISIAGDIQAASVSDSATVLSLRAIAFAKIDSLGISPLDRELAKQLVDLIAQELQSRVNRDLLKPEDRLLIADVMSWIQNAARL